MPRNITDSRRSQDFDLMLSGSKSGRGRVERKFFQNFSSDQLSESESKLGMRRGRLERESSLDQISREKSQGFV